jgi:hypothetical protein
MERLLINAQDITPSRQESLRFEKLQRLVPYFQEGRESELDSVILIQDKKNRLLFDGNHRLTLARWYDRPMDAMLYRPGELVQDLAGKRLILPIDLENARLYRQLSIEMGFPTFDHLIEESLRVLEELTGRSAPNSLFTGIV